MRSLLIISFLFSPVLLLGQGVFLDKDTSGVGAEIMFLIGEDFEGLAPGAGFSFNGVGDLGISFSKTSRNNTSATSISPNLGFHIAKDSPVALVLSVAYLSGVVSNSYLSRSNLNLRFNGVVFGGILYGRFLRQKNVSFVPSVGITRSHIRSTLKGSAGSTSDTDESTGFAFGIAFVGKEKSNTKIIFDVTLLTEDEFSAVSFGLGFVMPHTKKYQPLAREEKIATSPRIGRPHRQLRNKSSIIHLQRRFDGVGNLIGTQLI